MEAKTRLKAFLAGYDLGINLKQFTALAEMVAAADRDAYNRALEDAARIARSHVQKLNGLQIADAIRALKKA